MLTITNVLLVLALVGNVATLGLVYFLYRKSSQVSASISTNAQFLQDAEKQIELLQTKFQESLQNIISKDSQMVQNTSNNIIKYYQDTINALSANYNLNSQKLTETLNDELKKRIEELTSVVAAQSEESKKVFSNEIQKDLVLIKKDLANYSTEKFKEVDEKVYQIISETAKNTVGKVINMVDHQDLVMTALDQAKKDKFFN